MDKDTIIKSLLKMLQNSHTEKINMQLSIAQLTGQLKDTKKEETKKETNKSEK